MARVLVVDDNPDTVELSTMLLDLAGHRVTKMAHRMLLHDAGEEKIPIVLVSGRQDLSEVAGRMGTPYFLSKSTRNYGEALLKVVDRALSEGGAPAAA